MKICRGVCLDSSVRLGLNFGMALGISAALASASLAAPNDWRVPGCAVVQGTPSVTYTRNDGKSLAPLARALSGVTYTTSVAALDTPNRLLAIKDNELLFSTDAGCRFAPLARLNRYSGQPGLLAKSVGDRAYIWTDGGPELFRVDGSKLTALKGYGGFTVGFGTDRRNKDRARLGDGLGQLWETTDGGSSFSPLGLPAPIQSGIVYRTAFDPQNLDHVLVGTANDGAFVTFDGGRSWTQASGFADDGRANVFNLVVAPGAGEVVYAMGLNLSESDAGAPSGGRHIYISRDGGLNFAPLVDQSVDVTIVNGPTMAVSPKDPNALYFTFGTSFENYGTDIYRVDGNSGGVTTSHNGYHRMPAIEFNPADAGLLYLGVALENSGI